MRLPPSRGAGRLDFNMTPMIDVVFQLIIFSLLSSHLAQQELQLQLDLPEAESGKDTADEETRRVTISVLSDGHVLLAGKTVDREELNRVIGFEGRRVGRELEVRIRSDRSVPYRHVEPILLACAKSGVWNVTFAVVKKE